MISSALRDRLGDLLREETARSRTAGAGPSPGGPKPAIASRRIVRAGIEEILPGGVIEGPLGPLFVHERLYTDLGERPAPLLKKLAALEKASRAEGAALSGPRNGRSGSAFIVAPRRRPRDLTELAEQVEPPERGLFRRYGHRRMLFLDIETCGLSGAPVFLVGLCMIGERNLVLRQLFARDYAEERALLHELSRLASGFDVLVTFNGKTFDVPFLRDRAVHHRIPFAFDLPHLDLLWLARRRWKGVLPDCRLKTLEWHVLRRRRAGDVSGAEIPGLYHDYVRRGEPHRLLPVFHHNLLDVVAMAELIPPLFDPESEVY
jgi:uncharacterized protein YprB with RNaseH-like and TPR domain